MTTAWMHGLFATQRAACRAVGQLLEQEGGAILADAVGSGKTWVACAAAARWLEQSFEARDVVVVVPARLRSMWVEVAGRFDLTLELYSHRDASLQRLPSGRGRHALWIVDEAHHFRNPNTLRYHALARAIATSPTLLVTATPLHLGTQDVRALLELITPARSFHEVAVMQAPGDSEVVSGVEVCRRRVEHPLGAPLEPWHGMLDALSELELPVFGLDAELSVTGLIRDALVERLISHPVALLRSLERLMRYYSRCTGPDGVLLSRAAFRSIFGGGGPSQGLLSFAWPESGLSAGLSPAEVDQRLRPLTQQLRELVCSAVDHRAAGLEAELERHLGPPASRSQRGARRAVVFSRYAETAEHIAGVLRERWSTALLTGGRARWNGLPVSPEALIAALQPHPGPDSPPLQVLVCTDVLGEGHNLQGAEVLVHLDRPWNPVRLAQREGRLVRRGQEASKVTLVTLCPEASHPLLARFMERLECALRERSALASALTHRALSASDVGMEMGSSEGLHVLTAVYTRLRRYRRHPNAGSWLEAAAAIRKRLHQPVRAGIRLGLVELLETGLSELPEEAIAEVIVVLNGEVT